MKPIIPRIFRGIACAKRSPVIAVGLAVSLVLSWLVVQQADRRDEATFQTITEQRFDSVRANLDTALDSLNLLAAYFTDTTGAPMDRAKFARIVSPDLTAHRFIQSFSWSPKVDQAERAGFERRARVEGPADFMIAELDARGQKQAAADRPIFMPVFYAEPMSASAGALGIDLASDPARRQGLAESRDAGQARLIAAASPNAVLIVAPVFAVDPGADVSARRRALRGYVSATLPIGGLIEADAWRTASFVNIDLFDVSAPTGTRQLYPPGSKLSAERLKKQLHAEVELQVGGRTWLLLATPGPAVGSGPVLGFIMFTAGILATFFLAYSRKVGADRLEQAREDNARRTTDLNRRLTYALAATGEAIWDADIRTRTIRYSPRWGQLLGSEGTGLEHPVDTFFAFIHPSDRVEVARRIEATFAGVTSYQSEHRLIHRDGHEIWVLDRAKVVERSAGGKPIRAVGSITDITERKLLQIALLDSEIRLRERDHHLNSILDHLPSMVGYFDNTQHFQFANSAYERWYGINRDLISGMHVSEVLGEERYRLNRHYIEAALQGEPQNFERKIPRPSGAGSRQALVHYIPDVRDEVVYGVYVLVSDITAVKKAHTALRVARNELAAALALNERIITDAPVAIYLYREDGQCILANPAAASLSGSDQPSLLTQNFRTITSWQVSGLLEAAESVLANHQTKDCEVRGTTSSGRPFWADFHFVSMPMNGVQHLLVVADDVAEHRQAEQALRAAKETAEEATRVKSSFLATMSHEIRTPINGVMGLADLLLGTSLDQQQHLWVDRLQASSNHLLRLVDDILDFSRLEASQMQFDSVPFDPALVASEAFHMLEAQARAKDLQWDLVLPAAPLPVLLGDPARLRQILLNLLGNAIKFTEAGGVTLGIEPSLAIGNQVELECFVRDTGIGIPAEALSTLFQEFTQVDGSIARRFGGSGLGLAICDRLVKHMGGTIAVESWPGRGSCFRFRISLPTGIRQTVAAAPVAPPVTRLALRVLLAEDDPTSQMVTTAMLHRLGHSAQVAQTGSQAVAAVREGGFDVILMDMMMPGMDGVAATRAIRALDHPAARTRIIALTANALPEDERSCRDAGADDFLPKPLRLAVLESKLGRSAAPGLKPFDPGPAREMAEELGDETYCTIRDVFLADIAQRMDRLEGFAASRDQAAVRREAHTLKSSAAAFGLDALVALAAEIEAGSLNNAPATGQVARLRLLVAAAPEALMGHALAAQ
jgi:PAS domain S-box-containing protein